MRNKLILSALLILASYFFFSCDKDDDPVPDPNTTFKATINGASESSPNPSTATGSATATFNKDTKILTVNVTFTGLTPTAAHIHKGAVGVAGGVIFGFTAPITSPINYTSPALDAAQESDLFANLYYVNIHSAAYPGGEIRGQLLKQ
ncbi:MAG: CHRD domain-containing protein [Chitinophagaceae bacterium]